MLWNSITLESEESYVKLVEFDQFRNITGVKPPNPPASWQSFRSDRIY